MIVALHKSVCHISKMFTCKKMYVKLFRKMYLIFTKYSGIPKICCCYLKIYYSQRYNISCRVTCEHSKVTLLGRYLTSSIQVPLQFEVALFIHHTTAVAGLCDQMVLFNVPRNKSFVGILNTCVSAPMSPSGMVKGGRISTSMRR